MQAQLQSIVFIVPGADAEDWIPDDPSNFGLEAMAFIGPQSSSTSDSFDFAVCTPLWLHEEMRRFSPRIIRPKLGWYWSDDGQLLLGRGIFLVAKWNRNVITAQIEELVGRVSGESWNEVANSLDKVLMWEHSR